MNIFDCISIQVLLCDLIIALAVPTAINTIKTECCVITMIM